MPLSACVEKPAPAAGSISDTSSGVRKTPRRFETDALHNAAGTLPRAIDVNANTCACVSVTRDGDTIDLVVYGVAHTPDEVSDVELLSVHLDAAGEPEWTGESLSDAEYDRACRALLEASEEQEQRRAMLEAMGEWAATRAVEEAPEADIFDRIDRAYEMVKEARCAS